MHAHIASGPARCHALPGFSTAKKRRGGPAQVATRSRVQIQEEALKIANPHSTLKRALVVAVDHTEGSYKALKWTLEHLYRDGDVLHLLHVVPSSNMMMPQPFGLAQLLPPKEGLQEHMAAHAKQYFEAHCQLAQAFGAACCLDLVHGACNQAVSKTICKKVEDLAAAVVVLAERKPGLLDSIFQIPVSKQVAENCSRPTLIFHH